MKQHLIKRGLAILLAVAMVFTLAPISFADQQQGTITITHAGILCPDDTVGVPLAEPVTATGDVPVAPAIEGTKHLETFVHTTHVHSRQHQWYIHGYPCGNVKPGAYIRRDEVVAVTARGHGWNRDSSYYRAYDRFSADTFTDICEEQWSFGYFYTVYNIGALLPVEDKYFEPERPATRAEAAYMLSELGFLITFDNVSRAGADTPDGFDVDNLDVAEDLEAVTEALEIELLDAAEVFADVDAEHELLSHLSAALSMGWMVGYGDGTLRPDEFISRAEFITIFNRVLERELTARQVPDGTNPYSDLESTYWAYGNVIGASHDYDVVDWLGTALNDGRFNVLIERFVDQDGNLIAETITHDAPAVSGVETFANYRYVGFVAEVTHVYITDTSPHLLKEVSHAHAQVGDILTFTITVTNREDAAATWTNVVVTDAINEHLQFDGSTLAIDGQLQDDYMFENSILSVPVGNIAPGEYVVITFKALILNSAAGLTVRNTAIAIGDNGQAGGGGDTDAGCPCDPDDPSTPCESDCEDCECPGGGPGDCSTETEVAPTERDQDGTKTANINAVDPDGIITYTITATNPAGSPHAWYDVIIIDRIPHDVGVFRAGTVTIDGVAATSDQWTFGQYDPETLVVALGNIAPGTTVTVTFEVRVLNDMAGQTLTNEARIEGRATPTGPRDVIVDVEESVQVNNPNVPPPGLTTGRNQRWFVGVSSNRLPPGNHFVPEPAGVLNRWGYDYGWLDRQGAILVFWREHNEPKDPSFPAAPDWAGDWLVPAIRWALSVEPSLISFVPDRDIAGGAITQSQFDFLARVLTHDSRGLNWDALEWVPSVQPVPAP